MEECKKKSVLSQDIIGSTTFPVTSPAGKTAGAGARTRIKKDGPAEAAARIKKRKKNERKHIRNNYDNYDTVNKTDKIMTDNDDPQQLHNTAPHSKPTFSNKLCAWSGNSRSAFMISDENLFKILPCGRR